jgi:hypothetical protein
VKCTGTADCYAEAREICKGPYRIIESGNRKGDMFVVGPGGSNTWHEILIQCGGVAEGAKTTAAETAPKGAVATTLDAESAPTSAAGFNFGDTVDATNAQCKNAGHEWKGSGAKYKCTGTAVDTGLDAQARLAFCKDTLCRIDVVSPPPADAALLSTRLEKVLKLLTERYGSPTKREVTYPQSCAGAALPECLVQERARFLYQWSFKDRKAITLSLGAKKLHDPFEVPKPTDADIVALKTLRVRYDEGRVPDATKSAAATDESPAEREVGGL